MIENNICHRCNGSGTDPDQSNPTDLQLMYGDPIVCRHCDGSGLEVQEYSDWD